MSRFLTDRSLRRLLTGLALLAAIGSLGTDRAASEQPGDRELLAKYARPPAIPYPEQNQLTQARADLGRVLFFDPRLSGSNFIACASCHNPGFSWSDPLPKAIGHGMNELGRRTPSILNLAWGGLYFWDGRADSLEAQAMGPITAPGEMNQSAETLVAELRAIPGYPPLFAAAYPGEGITTDTISKALATFERGVISGEAPFDRWVAGDERAVSQTAKRGFRLFEGKAQCATCHSGWRFTDDSFYDIGVVGDDRGRGALIEGVEVLQYAFRTPGLRNTARRAPYAHNGSEKTLEDVIELYDMGGRVKRPSLSPEIRPLHLTAAEKSDLIAFLDTLTSADAPVAIPELPR
jgi:cytochrome c peroxidase